MKKVLLTSTALVALGGAAAAEVAISGNAEMGVVGGRAEVTDANGDSFSETIPVQFWQDMDVDFDMSGETDNGLSFGASVDLDEAGNLGNAFDDGGTTVFISGDWGTLTMGDTDGAADFVLDDMGFGNPGSVNDAETGHLGYNGSWLDGSGDGQIVRYDYSFDAFTVAVSVEQHAEVFDDDGNVVGRNSPTGRVSEDDENLTWAIGFGYDFEFDSGSAGVALAYQYSDNGAITLGGDADDQPINFQLGSGEVGMTAIGASVELDSGLVGAITYSNYNFDEGDDVEHIGIGAGYTFDAFTVHANWGQWTSDDVTISGWGIAGGYDLGGGLSLLIGYGDSSGDEDGSSRSIDSLENFSFGLSMSF